MRANIVLANAQRRKRRWITKAIVAGELGIGVTGHLMN